MPNSGSPIGGRRNPLVRPVETLVDTIGRALSDSGRAPLLLGFLALAIAIPCALTLRRRRWPFWVSTAVMASSLLFACAGIVSPMLLISALAIPVLTLAAGAVVLVPPALAYSSLVYRRPQHGLEATYALCAVCALASAAWLVVQASASV